MNSNKIARLLIAMFIIVFLFLAANIMLGKNISERILYQNLNMDTRKNSILQLSTWKYDLDNFLETYEGIDCTVVADDGNAVPATCFESNTGSSTWVVLVHGAGEDRVSTYPLAEEYLKRGYNVIAYDQRGCGDNGDERVTYGILESLDLDAVVIYTIRELSAKYVIVHGMSMGAQTASLYASGITSGDKEVASAVILDSPVPGKEQFLKHISATGSESIVTKYQVFIMKLYMNSRYHLDFEYGDTIELAKKNYLPTLVIASDKDTVCIPSEVEKIYNNTAAPNKMLMHMNSNHIEGLIDDPDSYMNGVMEFLNSVGL